MVAVSVLPQMRAGSAVKVKERHTVAPGATAPKVCDPPPVTPPVFCNMPTRLVVGPLPAFWTQKLKVTVSPGSITPFEGLQLSVVRLELSGMIAACGIETQLGNLKLPMRVLQLKLPFVAMYSWVYQKVQS